MCCYADGEFQSDHCGGVRPSVVNLITQMRGSGETLQPHRYHQSQKSHLKVEHFTHVKLGCVFPSSSEIYLRLK